MPYKAGEVSSNGVSYDSNRLGRVGVCSCVRVSLGRTTGLVYIRYCVKITRLVGVDRSDLIKEQTLDQVPLI